MPMPGLHLLKVTCPACHYSCMVSMEGDVFTMRACPRCKKQMETTPLNNPLLEALVKQLPPLRRFLHNRLLFKRR